MKSSNDSSGVRYPTQGFKTMGVGVTSQGYPPHPYETFSYDLALYEAQISDFNVVPYTSVLPIDMEFISVSEAQAGPSWVHGGVLEVIMAGVGFEYLDQGSTGHVGIRRHGRNYVVDTDGPVMAGGSMLGIVTGVKDQSGNVVGGYVAEYVGIYSSYIGPDSASSDGQKQLGESIDHELSIRGYDTSSGTRSFTNIAYVEIHPDEEGQKYAYTLSAIGFTRFSYAVAPQ